MKKMYDTNIDFKAFVDKYMIKEGIDLYTALTHRIVREYADYLISRGSSELILKNMWGSAGAAHENVEEV